MHKKVVDGENKNEVSPEHCEDGMLLICCWPTLEDSEMRIRPTLPREKGGEALTTN